ncbi:MAG: 3-oxoacyl-ACP reductase FabG [Deinococcales bacterium]
MNLHDKVALITGASRGIGRGIAKVLATHGMRLALNYRHNEAAASETLEAVKALGAGAILIRGDVQDEEQVAAMLASVEARYGRLDVLVNNAGVDSAYAPNELSLEEWNRIVGVNLTGAFLCSRGALGIMREQGRGRIIMISSIAGLRGTGNVHYVASKAGMLGLTMALARATAGSGITVNAIAPGLTRSEMLFESQPQIEQDLHAEVPLGRLGEPEEIGEAVAFLAQHEYITGETVNVSGGRYIGL